MTPPATFGVAELTTWEQNGHGSLERMQSCMYGFDSHRATNPDQ